MFGVVAPHEHQLSLAVHVEGINNAKPLLAPAPSPDAQAVAEHQPHQQEDEDREDEKRRDGGSKRQQAVISR